MDYDVAKAERMGKLTALSERLGLHHSLWAKYRLTAFEVNDANREAYDMVRSMFYVPKRGELWGDLFPTHEDLEAWLDTQRCLDHHFLTLVGEPGRGKTHLALGLGIWIAENHMDPKMFARYFHLPQLVLRMKATFNDNAKETLETIIERCMTCELLILDDIGAQRSTEWVTEQLDAIIDYRYREERLTLFTTNLKPEQLPPRIASRIIEGEIAVMTGTDFRIVKAQRRAVEHDLKSITGGLER